MPESAASVSSHSGGSQPRWAHSPSTCRRNTTGSGTLTGLKMTPARRATPGGRCTGPNRITLTPATARQSDATNPPRNPPAIRSVNQCARSHQRSANTSHHSSTRPVEASTIEVRRRRVTTIAEITMIASTVIATMCELG